mgnify:CR=1 FL=1
MNRIIHTLQAHDAGHERALGLLIVSMMQGFNEHLTDKDGFGLSEENYETVQIMLGEMMDEVITSTSEPVPASFYVGDPSAYHDEETDLPIDNASFKTMHVYGDHYLSDFNSTTLKYVVIFPVHHISMIAVWA